MTAESLAQRLQARRVGAGRWSAKCPAHDDRSPSLSLCEGLHGRILLHCFAGCRLKSILDALGLTERDLFADPRATSAEVVPGGYRPDLRLAVRREGERSRALADQHREWSRLVEALGVRLAEMSDDHVDGPGLTALFHVVLGKLRLAEEQLEAEEIRRFHERLIRFQQRLSGGR